MGPTPARRAQQRAAVGALSVLIFAGLGLVVSFFGRSGGGEHHCDQGSTPTECSYPLAPWHWVAGLVIGALIGLLVFLVWLATQKTARRTSRRTSNAGTR